MAFPEGIPEKKGQFLRPGLRQPKMAYDAREREAGPGAGADPIRPRAKEEPLKLRQVELGSKNRHGLRSKSEEMYPEAYVPVDTVFWEGLTDQQQLEVMRLQAQAQEKVGYERGTQKFFMQDFDTRAVDKRTSGERLVEIETPRLVIAGAMLGAAATMGAALLFKAFTSVELAITALVLALLGSIILAIGRN